jgi:hypothetical protein
MGHCHLSIQLLCVQSKPFFTSNTCPKLPVIYRRKVRTTSSRHDPYGLGYTRVTMVTTKGGNDASRSES